MTLVSQRIPNRRELQDEAVDGAFAGDGFDSHHNLGFTARAIDLNATAFGVDQPTELRATQEPFLHPVAQPADAIRFGSEFDDEVRAEVPVGIQMLLAQLADLGLQHPRSVRRAAGTAGKNVARGRIIGDATLVQFGPTAQLPINFGVLRTCEGVIRGRHDKVPFGGHFKEEVRMFSTEFGELLIGHRRDGECCREEGFVDQEGHGLSLSKLAWGQNHDITVVTVGRNA